MCEHNQENRPCWGCLQEDMKSEVVFTCKHLTDYQITPIPGQETTRVICHRCYQPRHQTRHSPAYYATRSFVRGIVYTLLAVTAVFVFCASVIILGAAF